MTKRICLLGATGSIGKNCLDIVDRFPETFKIQYLSAHSNAAELLSLAQRYRPEAVAYSGEPVEPALAQGLERAGVRFLHGKPSLEALAREQDYDVLVNAIVGAAGLRPTLAAVENGKTVALANKETLVAAGEIVTARARQKKVDIIPIDSEHSALWQCLAGEDQDAIERIILTASGGPFRELPAEAFRNVTIEQALAHPNWSMGPKITIDSATLMNKGLEVIEAHWLFDLPAEKISVLIHPQSIIHSMVEFIDGSIKAQMGLPDMRLPIQYALTQPGRLENSLPRMNFRQFNTLTFFEPDTARFPALDLAFAALREAGTAPAVLNAANEQAVHAFIHGQIRFDEIPHLVERALAAHDNLPARDLETVLHADRWARAFVRTELQK